MKYKYLFFDLDGTLTDSALGIVRSAQYALSHFGIDVKDEKELYPFVGPPLEDSFKEFYHFSEENAHEAVKIYRSRYEVTGVYENEPYKGVHEFLETLRERGYVLVVATSKPQAMADVVMTHFDLSKYFDLIIGRDKEGRLHTKADVIRHALDAMEITKLDDVIMIGDRKYDVNGAKAVGMDTIGVLYGYGSRQELLEAGAVSLAENFDDLLNILD